MTGADLRALAGRLVVGLAGPVLLPVERRWLVHWRPAGAILFARNCRDEDRWRRLVADLRAVLTAGAELCADHEGGPVSFLQAVAGRPPAARTLGEVDRPDLTRRVHAETARRLRGLGLDRVLAPCCDVLRAPASGVIGARAFAADAGRAARHAAAAMAGLRDGGLLGCAKHWPGHGTTAVDTHEDAARAGAAAGSADDREPFFAAVAAGADAVMAAHLPAGPRRPPLSLDAAGLGELRRELGAAHLRIFSDDVSMGALRAPLAAAGVASPDGRSGGLVDPAALGADWLAAVAAVGCDRLLLRGIPWRALPLPDGAGAGDGDAEAGAAAAVLAAAPIDLLETGPPAAAYDEARRLAAAGCALRHGPEEMLWFDTTAGDRLGEAAGLEPAVRRWWPRAVRFDAAAGSGRGPSGPFVTLLATAQRPLTVEQAHLLRSLVAPGGTALAAGHPGLAGDLAHLLGPGWRLDALYDCAAPDLAALVGPGPGTI